MSLVGLGVSNLVSGAYVQNRWILIWRPIIQFSKHDTYCVIFGPAQDAEQILFNDNSSNLNILYKSPKATNSNHHPIQARNTLYVFELKDEVPAVPTVQS